MADKEIRTLDDILNDDALDELLKPLQKPKKTTPIDPDIQIFKDIEEWVKKHGRRPEQSRTNLKERSMFSKLKGLQKKVAKLQPYDSMGLLVAEEPTVLEQIQEEIKNDTNTKTFTSLDDILNDDSVLFSGIDGDDALTNKIFDTAKVTRKQTNNPESVAKRRKVKDFDKYSHLFKKVQSELASGHRKLVPFKNYEILLHHFYVLRGQLLYVESMDEEITQNFDYATYKNRRIHIIYENGTESNVLYRGLAASLYGRSGKMVTELEEDFQFSSEDITTGYIYVVKSLSKNPEIANIKSLFKIGVTSGSVKKRLANAENESTYLYAPVQLVEQFQVVNLKPESLEKAIHHALVDYQLEVEITGPNGKIITPKEWFVVELDKVEEIINTIVSKLQQEQ
ncbi:GIY-YIG nuclease family protein [Enterococcus cecorum]|uniref:Bacteriophage T5 Orf172 DNA-binding domain-containing protein n=1 Tax=Enterococcus cecorum TaxID=44008 RepID=A0A366SIH2_9ENTE|nr:GIY-YIG nuclease family protein [Enterococcus cecorum]RBR31642.1 hypothetical protein EB18_00064 [Enterococcus cecorum]